MSKWIIVTRFGETFIIEADNITDAISNLYSKEGQDSDNITLISKLTEY